MNGFLVKIMLSAAILLALNGSASAELVKGRVKSIAGEAKLFTMMVAPDKVLMISWDSKTAWKGVSKSSDMMIDETLSVDFRLEGDSAVASIVSRNMTPVPTRMKVMTLEMLADNLNGVAGSRPLILIDTRPAELYDAGHIPGAVSVPHTRLEKRTSGLLPEEKGAGLVFYDEGQGGDSAGKCAEISARYGYSDVAVLREGTSGWVNSGRFLASSTAFIRKTRPAVIDIRSAEQVLQGHIEKAVSYPAARLKEFAGNFPKDKFAPIVVYGDSDREAIAAAETIRSWGYQRVTVYPGGVDAWVKNAEVPATGHAEKQITSGEGSHGGNLQTNDFKMALISPVMVEIVDVRTSADQKKGTFPKSKIIPLQELAIRHGELDRKKIQVVFAADAGRAEMAYDFLKMKGYRVNFLNGSVWFDKDGNYNMK